MIHIVTSHSEAVNSRKSTIFKKTLKNLEPFRHFMYTLKNISFSSEITNFGLPLSPFLVIDASYEMNSDADESQIFLMYALALLKRSTTFNGMSTVARDVSTITSSLKAHVCKVHGFSWLAVRIAERLLIIWVIANESSFLIPVIHLY